MKRWTKWIELMVGIALGLGFFLIMLGLLNWVFPDATGMGMLVRSDGTDGSGRALVLEGPDTTDVVAQLWDVQGVVKDRSSSSVVWDRSQEGIGLEDRHAVQSRRGSTAMIAFNATNKLMLEENTLVVVRRPNRLAPDPAARASVLFVEGALHGRLDGMEGGPLDVEILTANGSIHAKGDESSPADFRLSSGTSGAATLSIHGGAAEVRVGDRTTRVEADQALTLNADGTVGVPVRLPGRPTPRAPETGESFRYRSAPPRIAFDWTPVASAERYRVQIARDKSFEKVVFDGEVSEPRFVHGNLREGSYFWRASAKAGDAESRPSRTGRFSVIEDREAPLLSVQLPDVPMHSGPSMLRGRAEPGCRVLVGDRSVVANESGEFTVNLDLRDGYNVLVVQAIDPAGNTAFVTREIYAGAAAPGEFAMKMRVHIPIRFKFMITFLVIVTAVVGLITFSTATLFRDDKQSYINDLTSMIALGAAEELQAGLDETRKRLQIYAGMLTATGLRSEEKTDLSKRFFEDFPDLISVTLSRADEQPLSVYDTGALESAGLNHERLGEFEKKHSPEAGAIADGGTWIVNSTLVPTLPSYLMIFEDGDKTVSAWLRSERLLDIAARFSAYRVFVADSDGTFLIHSDRRAVTSRERADGYAELAAFDHGRSAGVTAEYVRDETELIGGFAGMSLGKMVAGAEIPRSATNLASQRLIRRVLTMAVVLIVSALVLAFIGAMRITRPVENLVSATHAVAKGEFDVQVDRESLDEIGDLADSFTHMTSELKSRDSALKEAQGQLIQSEKMAAFGQLGAGVAHEVKNPLAGILASAQIARSEAEEGTQVWKDLSLIEKETKRCREIIDNLLRFARQEKSVKEQVAVNTVINDSIAIVHHQLELAKVKIFIELQDDLPPVLGNANQLQQVFMNLMINAQQAMGGTPGSIRVSTKLTERDNIEIRFADDGPGMPPLVKEKLFEPFFTTKPAGKGTGLGLSVSYGVIEDHEGKIVVESELAHGATFIITLPRFTEAAAERLAAERLAAEKAASEGNESVVTA